MRKNLRRILLLIALMSAAMFLWQFLQGASADESYDDAARLAFHQPADQASSPASPETAPPLPEEKETLWVPAPIGEEDPNIQALEAVDLKALREVNPDVIGWIMIPDSKVNYPLMQGTDNDFYLKHTWQGKKNSLGSIFMEHRNSSDLTDFNTIIYGHNMTNGSMFGSLRQFSGDKYRQKRPYVYIVSDQGVFRYEIFALYKAPVDGPAYGLSFNETKTRVNFLTEAKKRSRAEIDVIPDITDRILTLSTCSGDGYSNRWVVQARLKMVPQEQR